jgi:hypothetical protein
MRTREDLGPVVVAADVRRRWRARVTALAAGNVAITTLTVVGLHLLGLA